MRVKVKPEGGTNLQVAPSEQPGYLAALMIENEYVDAILLLTEKDVKDLIAMLAAQL